MASVRPFPSRMLRAAARSIAAGLAAALPLTAASAQPATEGDAPKAAPAKAATTLRPVHVFGKDPYYPPELARAGVQGTATVMAVARSDGSTELVVVQESSRSPALDAIALDLVRRSSFKVTTGDREVFLVPVDFRRDSVTDLPRKPCAELNADLDYFRRTFPERDETEAPVFTMAAGMVAVQLPAERRGAFSRAAADVALQAISACAGDPSRVFFAEYTRIATGIPR